MAARASLSSIETLVSELSLSRPDSSSSSNEFIDTSPPLTPSSRRRTESNPPMVPLMPSAATTTRRLNSNASVDAPLERTHKITDTASSSTTPESMVTSPHSGPSTAAAYDWHQQSLNLCMHIYSRGFIDGIGSDITVSVPAWNKQYKLHRLVLDQNPYFSTLLNGSFREASSGIVTLHFDDSNSYVTADSFEFVLARLYGKMNDPDINHSNVRHILATCSYLQLEQLCDQCYHFITSDLQENNVVDYLIFANQYALHGSSRILEAVLTFLCREAWNMDRLYIAHMPVEWLQKLIESDAFWVPSEYDRYRFATQVISEQRRMYRDQQQEHNRTWVPSRDNLDISKSTVDYARSRRQSGLSDQPTLDMTSMVSSTTTMGDLLNDEHEAVYQDIFSNSIFYTHMTFDQLEKIRKDRDEMTRQRYVPDHVLKDALWQQIELRSRIESANEKDTDLGLTSPLRHDSMDDHPRVRYVIPSDDTTTSTGESALSQAIGQKSVSSSIKPIPHTATTSTTTASETYAKSYSSYPPFRFSVEFSDVAQLKPNVKVYSKNVFYAGSNWNMYIQKHKSQRKGPLLGIYLHRQSIPASAGFGHTGPAVGGGEHGGNSDHSNTRTRSDSSSANSAGYSDKRKCVRTWFKIFCPAKGPKHALTLFQSCPDEFTVSQSWGWKSTSLYSDKPSVVDEHQGTSLDAEMTRNAPGIQTPTALRFSVVMGHV